MVGVAVSGVLALVFLGLALYWLTPFNKPRAKNHAMAAIALYLLFIFAAILSVQR